MTLTHLMRLRARVALLRARRSSDGFMVLFGILLVLGVIALAGSTVGMRLIARERPALAETLLLLTFAGIGTFQFLAGFRNATLRLFLSSDVEVFLSAPVTHAQLWWLKVAETAGAADMSTSLLGIVTTAYVLAVAPAALLLALPVAVLTPAGAAISGAIAAMALARLVPAKRLEQALAIAGPLMGVSMGLLGPVLIRLESTPGSTDGSLVAFEGLRSALRAHPAVWAGSAVSALADARFVPALSWLGAAGVSVAVLGWAGYALFRSTFYVSLGRVQESAPRRRGSGVLDRLAPPLPAGIRAIVLKDWRLVLRDPKQTIALLMPLVMVGYFAVVGSGAMASSMAVVVPIMLGGLGAQALRSEGRNITLLRSVPLDARDVFWAKVWTWALPVSVLALTGAVALGLFAGHPVVTILWQAAAAVALTTLVLAVNLAVWMLFADMRNINPDRPDVGVGLLATVVNIAFMAGAAALPGWLIVRGAAPDTLGHPVVGVLASIVSAATLFGTRSLVRRAIRRLEELECQ